MNRAYSILEIKSFDADQRIIEGVASTPTADRVGDIVKPMGAKFKLPMPLLWQHKSDKPIGEVYFAQATETGIPFKAKIAKTSEPGILKDRLDEAWQSIKLGLVKAVSIGFAPIKFAFMKDGGMEFSEWEWLELSAVTIPANTDATINVIRSIDTELRAAIGNEQSVTSNQSIPGDTGANEQAGAPAPIVKAKEAKVMAKKSISDQIAGFEATRATKSARMEELMNEAAEKSETLGAAEKDEYDGLETEVESIDDHLKRLRKMQATNAEAAKPVEGTTAKVASESRAGVVQVRSAAPPGIGFARMVIAKLMAHKQHRDAMTVAREQWPSNPEVEMALKTAVAPADMSTSGWASQLAPTQNLQGEFIEYLRPMTLIGRVPGFRRVPFNVTVPRQTAATSGGWVGEGKSKPLKKGTFDTVNLKWAKAAGIVVFTEEIGRFSNPSIEAIVRNDLATGIAQFLDEQLLDPSVNTVANVSPASITYAADTDTASGTTAADLIHDIKKAFLTFQGANIPINGAVWVMEPNQAVGIAMMQNAFGQQQFPGVTIDGGVLYGIPVYTSNSAGSGQVTLFKPSEVLLADDGGVSIDVSNQASLHLDDTSTDGAAELVSLWANNLIGVRAERFVNWVMARNEAVYVITSASYGGVVTA